MLFWAFAALALDAPNTRLADDIALTKATISVSAPLIAFGYLIWHWRWSHRRQPLASLADPF
jgi:hypothetical protein